MSDRAEHRAAARRDAEQQRRSFPGGDIWTSRIIVDLRDGMTFEERRNGFASAIRGSSWFRGQTPGDELWEWWDEIKDAETPEHYDFVASQICAAAELERVLIRTRWAPAE